MAQATLKPSPHVVDDPDALLYKHVKRPEWGAGLMIWERDNARAYQFEDGRLRKIRKGYYKLLEPTDVGDRAEIVRQNLLRAAGAGEDAERKVLEPAAPFEAQVELFIELYPQGFQDPEWIDDHRRSDGAALKRHRGPISEEARESLSEDRCAEALQAGEHEELAETIADLMARTDLVPISHAKALRGLETEEKKRYAESVANLLHGEGRFEERFKGHLEMLRATFEGRPSWRIATVLPGLVHPETHTVVRRSAFLRQAGSIAPTARYTRRATVAGYRSFQRVARLTRERLAEASHEARDLLDVYDFIWTTLRTSALEHLGSSGS